ncbi:MAG: Uma2 family endonuclease [Tunicatimonas sp.]
MEKEALVAESVPESLIYEEIDGQPIYYRGYREVLAGQKKLEDIMGCSDVQGLVVSVLLDHLYHQVDKSKYRIVTNEIGLHVDTGSNLSSDIALYDKALLQKTPLKNKYFAIPPRAVIEVDTNAETSNFNASADYYHLKTEKLFEFGVKEIIWFFTKTRKVSVAYPQQDWLTKDWSKPVNLLGTYSFSLAELLEAEGIKLPS